MFWGSRPQPMEDEIALEGIKISVIVPVYNVEKYLEECLDSVLMQKGVSFEIICIDDGSTDGSGEILNDYVEKYNNLIVIKHEKNRGLSVARNTGISAAKGKYIMFVDSDDAIVEDSLKFLFQTAEENCTDIIYYDMYTCDDKMMKKNEPTSQNYNGTYQGIEMFGMFMENNDYKVQSCRQFCSTDFLKNNYLYFKEGIIHEDLLFTFLGVMKAKRVLNANKCLYLRRIRAGSINSAIQNSYKAKSLFVVLMEIFTYWNNNQFTDKENDVITKYFMCVYHSFRKAQNFEKSNDGMQYASCAEKIFYELLYESNEHMLLTLKKSDLDKIKKYKKKYIYGAGNAAIELIEEFNKNHIIIDKILVNDQENNPKELCGISVCHYRAVCQRNECIVIIGITSKKAKGVKEVLTREGYKNIIELEDKEEG